MPSEGERPFQMITKTRFIKKPVDGKPFLTELRIVGDDAGIKDAMKAISKPFIRRRLVGKLKSLDHLQTSSEHPRMARRPL